MMSFGSGKTVVAVALCAWAFSHSAEAAANCLRLPVSCPISSPFGNRYDPVAKDYSTRMHKGVDFACPIGTPVGAAEGGTVIKSRFQYIEGNQIAIRGNSGMTQRYFHGNSLPVSVDPVQGPRMNVSPGDLVMMSGNSGARTTGPHLHFQVESANGEATNPAPLFCGGAPAAPASILDAPGAPTDAEPTRSAVAPINSPELPAHVEGSFYSVMEDLIAARAANPDYPKQLATLSAVRLYSELSYIDGISLRVRAELQKRRERIQALGSLVHLLRAEQILQPQIAAQKSTASRATRQP